MNSDKLVFTTKSVIMSKLFRDFADLLDNNDKVKRTLELDIDAKELMEIVRLMRKYTWEKMEGVCLS